jgi:hypothetical protein
VLADSFRRHNPGHRFLALVIDDPDGQLGGGKPFEEVTPLQVGIDRAELHRRATMFTTHWLAASLKPDLIRHLLVHDEPVLFLDADSCVYADLDPLAELVARDTLVLSPHSLDPHPLYEDDSAEQVFVRHGVINAGLLGAGRGAEPFLDWWRERTARRTVIDLERGLVAEQGWLAVATAIFEHRLLRDQGCNVMGWNLQGRDVEWRGEVPFIGGAPLRHFHFNFSFDPERPHLLAPFQENPPPWASRLWPMLEERPGVARICRDYAERLLAAGYRESRREAPGFAAMPDGRPFESWMRERYRNAVIRAEATGADEPPNPFTHGPDRFTEWLRGGGPPASTPPDARAALAEAEIRRLRKLVNDLTGTWSWRVTRPLRWLGALRRGH